MKNPQTEKTATACQKTPTWTDQARNAIRQGQSLNDFVSHCHIDNRRQARKAFLSARLAIIPNEQERQELMASVNHATALAEALAETRHALYNETAGKQDSHWIKTVKANAAAALAAWEEAK